MVLVVLAVPVSLGARYLADAAPSAAGVVHVLLTATVAAAGVAAVGAGLGAPDPELEASTPRSRPSLRLVHLGGALLAVALLLGVGQYVVAPGAPGGGTGSIVLVTLRNVVGLFGLQALAAVVLGPRLGWLPPLIWVAGTTVGGVGSHGVALVASMPRLPVESRTAALTAGTLLALGTVAYSVGPELRRGASATESAVTQRIPALDVVRGLALCGILMVNLVALLHMPGRSESGEILPLARAVELLAHQRFFPIFSFLFGVSFALILRSRRSPRPRLALVRRLLVLVALGAVHRHFHPGEALFTYGVFGLVALLPASWLPSWAVIVLGVADCVWSIGWCGGQALLVPGLFLLGLGTVRLGLIDGLERRVRWMAAALAVAAPATVLLTWWQNRDLWDGGVNQQLAMAVGAAAGLLGAVSYGLAVVLAVLRGPLVLRTAMHAVLGPLGRTALTNYLLATVLVLVVGPVLGLDGSRRYGSALLMAAVIVAVQVVGSRWWLARFRYGPVEWVLRCITWWRVVPLR